MNIIKALFVLIAPMAHALELSLPVQKLTCRKQVFKNFSEWKATGDWKAVFVQNSTVKKWVSPTQDFGHWVFLETTDAGDTKTIAEHSQYKFKSITFDADCREKTREVAEIRPKDAIDDQMLVELAKKNSKFLLVLWSPEMAYTGPALKELKKIEKEIPVEYFLEENAPLEQAKILQTKYKLSNSSLRRLKSLEFTIRQARSHLPVMYLLKDGKVQGFGWHGFRSAYEIKKLLREK